MYNHIVVGGTFDTLHSGHAHFLTRAFGSAKTVTIGLTSEAYIRRFKKDLGVSPFSLRYRALTAWLRKNGYSDRARVVSLDNKWGPVLLPDGFDAIAVTSQNKNTALEINTIRTERGLPPLAIVEIELIDAQDKKPISSTRIRNRQIDTRGALLLPDSLRPELQKPLGHIIANAECKAHIVSHRDDILIAVGDVTTETILYCGVQPSLIVVDLHVERKPYQSLSAYKFPKKYQIMHLSSGPGFISRDAIRAISVWKSGIPQRRRLAMIVKGEEDLLVLPAIAAAPIGSVVYYGSPPISGTEGLVEVTVTREIKQKIKGLMSRFTRTRATS